MQVSKFTLYSASHPYSPKAQEARNRDCHGELFREGSSFQQHGFKSGQVFKIIVTDQAVPIGYAVDGGQLGSASLAQVRQVVMN